MGFKCVNELGVKRFEYDLKHFAKTPNLGLIPLSPLKLAFSHKSGRAEHACRKILLACL